MATRLKPTRINVDNDPRVGDGASYQNDNDFHWSEGGGDMSYEDFEWVTLTGNSLVIENISNNVTPTENFTVSAGTLRPGIEYVLRVNTGNTPYTMTLGTGVTNPNGYSTDLTPNKVNQFKFIATSDSQLELEGVDGAFVTINTAQSISGKKTFTTEPAIPNKTSAPTNDGTKPASEKQVYDVAQELNNAVKLTGNQTVNGTKTFTTSPVVPSKTTDAANTGTAIATEAQVYKKANKVSSATENNLASLTSAGDLADSGIAKSTVELNTNKETGDAPTDSTSKYPSSHTVKKYVDDQVSSATAGAVSDASYDPTTWDGVAGIAPSKNAVRDKIVSMDSNISTNASDISTINGKIPSEASTSNQLADKAYVGDSINSVTAYYITKNANGDQFATYAELAAATTFYSGGVARVPTRNDYTIVLDDENHDHATTRYIYNSGWEYQYTINETPLTQAQLDALNSGITANKVSTYDGYATTISGKQDALTLPSSVTSGNAVVFGSNNKTLNDAGAAPVLVTGNQTIAGTKTFSTSPVVPNKTADATNTGTAVATEAQVYKKQNTLVSGTNIKTINSNSLLGSGDISLNDVKVASSAPASPTEGMIWYDTTNDQLKVYDGTNWNVTGKEYYAGEGIEFGTIDDYSAMQGPCPDGFHVPKETELQVIVDSRTTFNITYNVLNPCLKMPWAGYLIGGSATNQGKPNNRGNYGYYLSCEAYSSSNPKVLSVGNYSNPYIASTVKKSDGSNIRPFKDTPVVPDSSWTVLYDGSSTATGAGIFHNATLGLISISLNGQSWITMSDKNLGATQVYNSGDALSEDNCGYMYQWGNNHGFPFEGVDTVSTTQVNANTYGPGNYYNSSTFIRHNSGWDSSNNPNLRGGVTGVVQLNNAITNTGVLSVNGQTGNVSGLTTHSTIQVTLTTAGWSSNTQTVTATGVTASNTVFVSPAPASFTDYGTAQIYASAQASDSLTFTCGTVPTSDITVNVVILN